MRRVQIVNREHPHFEEYGQFTGKIIVMPISGYKMAEIALEDCPQGIDTCFVGERDVQEVAER